MRNIILLSALLALSSRAETPPPLPTPILPDGLGVNIHFTDPRPGEMKMLAEGGFRWIRMDFNWGAIEREKGKYDFTAYERLLAALEPHHIRAVFILDYSNKLYDGGVSPHTDEGRQAFAQWAAAAAVHFKGRGILWEMYNEPNIGFWKPAPNAGEYTKLALATGKALRETAPDEIYIGPATSEIDLPFVETCFKAGLLEYWSAVSTHPYRQSGPETAALQYRKLRRMIAQYGPKGKTIPILSGEWGYSAGWKNFDDEKQGKMLPRQYLTNIANEIPLSIWYDWHDDGTNPKEPEHHFGTVNNAYHKDRDPVYEPKPAYNAARTLTTFLNGYTFSKRIPCGSADDYVLLFLKEKDVRLAAWTRARNSHEVTLSASAGKFQCTSHIGQPLDLLVAGAAGLSVTLTDAPQYLSPEEPNDLLLLAAAWKRAPLELAGPGPRRYPLSLEFHNPLARSVELRAGNVLAEVGPGLSTQLMSGVFVGRGEEQLAAIEWDVSGAGKIVQEISAISTNPIRITVSPQNALAAIKIENVGAGEFAGAIVLVDANGKELTEKKKLQFKAGENEQTVVLDMPNGNTTFGVRVLEADGTIASEAPCTQYHVLDVKAENLAVLPDGDGKVASEQSLSSQNPPEGPPMPGHNSLKLSYRFDAGWKFVRLVPKTDDEKKIEGKPRKVSFWLYGDGSGNSVRARFSDSTQQTFQPAAESMNWKGWRHVSIPVDGKDTPHWGGANDGSVHYPIRWDTILLIDSAGRKKTQGEIYLSTPVLTE